MEPQLLHIMCTTQVHTCSNISDKQIESASEQLSASANYLKKLVEGKSTASPTPVKGLEDGKEEVKELSTVTLHADASYSDILKGFTVYDSRDVDSDAYLLKRQIYDVVRQKYPDVDNLIRDEKIQALKELKSVGFKYYSTQVVAFVKIEGMTRTVSSRSHHRLDRPGRQHLEFVLTDIFKGKIRLEEDHKETPEPKADNAES